MVVAVEDTSVPVWGFSDAPPSALLVGEIIVVEIGMVVESLLVTWATVDGLPSVCVVIPEVTPSVGLVVDLVVIEVWVAAFVAVMLVAIFVVAENDRLEVLSEDTPTVLSVELLLAVVDAGGVVVETLTPIGEIVDESIVLVAVAAGEVVDVVPISVNVPAAPDVEI